MSRAPSRESDDYQSSCLTSEKIIKYMNPVSSSKRVWPELEMCRQKRVHARRSESVFFQLWQR
jgi:hypothetical protein